MKIKVLFLMLTFSGCSKTIIKYKYLEKEILCGPEVKINIGKFPRIILKSLSKEERRLLRSYLKKRGEVLGRLKQDNKSLRKNCKNFVKKKEQKSERKKNMSKLQ